MEAGMGPDSDTGASPAAGTEQAASAATEEREEVRAEEEEDAELLTRAQNLISKISASQDNPNPSDFHALAHMLETHEAKYIQESANSSFGDGRGSHTIGRLAGILHDNEDFVTSISTKFLSENRFPVSVRAAAARLLLSGSSTWMVFEEAVIENCKNWLMENTVENVKAEMTRDGPSDSEMLKTYSTGILAISLTGGGEIVEDVLSSGLSLNLMHYLRLRNLGDISAGHKDHAFPAESKNASSARCREENRGKVRHVIDGTHLDGPRLDEGDHDTDNPNIREIQQMLNEEPWEEGMPLNSGLADPSNDAVDIYSMTDEAAEQNSEVWQNKEMRSVKSRYTERHDDNTDEGGRDLRRRVNRGLLRSRGKGRIGEGATDNERLLASSASEPQVVVLGQSIEGLKTGSKNIAINSDQVHPAMFDDSDDRTICIVGSRDISNVVKKAIQAAEAEAGTANAPAEAIKAAGDAAADLVKTSALEAWTKTNDSEAAVLAASEAASTVINAALSSEISCTSNVNDDSSKALEQEEEESEPVFLPDADALAQLREKYCIQCLEILGEYVEALGPVLHEKGVDVCLQLLQCGSKQEEASNDLVMLPEVLKLICALAAHKKFAALFVDRGGIQKLLAVQRTTQTFFGLSSCLYTIGCHQGIMERVCTLPSGVVNQVVELALQLLECSQDQARKNAAMFLAVAFIFRAIVDSFDAQEGLQKMLNLLHSAASTRSGLNSGTLGFPNERPLPEVLTTSEKQIAYQTCITLRQYFRSHLLLLVDSLRPNKANRSVARNSSSARAAYRPLDISNENMETIFTQIQRDRKLGPAFVRARWPVVDKFLASNGHITMLELCQAPPGERYLHDLAQYALGVLHIITLVPYSRKPIVNASLSNDRVGMALILDAANGAAYVDPEMIRPALDLLVNLVCPPPSISIKSSVNTHGQQSASTTTPTASATENRDRRYDRNLSFPIRSELRERDGGEPGHVERATGMASVGSSSHSVAPTISSGVVGDRRISLGPGAGCAGFAAQLEQGYHQARETVRANNGIKVLLHLLHPRMVTPPGSLDCIRALACRVLLGLARDDTIAHILTKLQVGKKLSELIRDQSSGTEQGRWQAELAQVAIELIAIVTNSGRASTLVATDAAAPTLRRIERAAIAAATPITYDSRELLLLIYEHLQASGLTATAAFLQKEATLTSSLSVPAPQPIILYQNLIQEASKVPLQFPSGRASCGFLTSLAKATLHELDGRVKSDSFSVPSKKKQLPSAVASQGKNQHSPFILKTSNFLKSPVAYIDDPDVLSPTISKNNKDLDISQKNPKAKTDADNHLQKTPILLPLKRKFVDCRDSAAPTKRLATMEACQSPVFQTPKVSYKSSLLMGTPWLSAASALTPRDHAGISLMDNSEDALHCSTPGSLMTSGLAADTQPGTSERMTLDSLVVQYLKHQHRQCPAPITTLPPLSLLHPHVCPEPSHKRDAPANVTARVSAHEFREHYGGIHARRRDRQFVYSRFRPWRTCRDDAALLRCMTFLGDSSRFATGGHSGELKIFDSYSGNVLENNSSYQSPVMFIDSAFSSETQLILTSMSRDVMLWDASSISGGAIHSFEGCKAARFSQSGLHFAALSSDMSRREILLYDVQRYDVDQKFHDNLSTAGQSRGLVQSLMHFSPLDTMLLWNGILWDRRCSIPVHHFDQFTDYGGGGFHPAGNEVIINSEVWDLRKFKLLRSVPSLDQTIISFNGSGDVIYAILRRNMEDITSAGSMRRYRHPLFAAFRTIDATNYSDIATIPVDRRVLDLATEPTDSCVGIVAMDDSEELFSSARLYEIGRKRPTDDDSDPDDGAETDEDEEDEEDSEGGVDALLDPSGSDGDGDSEADDLSDDDEVDSIDDEAEFNIDVDFDGQGMLEIVSDAEDDDSEGLESTSDEDEDYIVY